jgi:hypothetical protein
MEFRCGGGEEATALKVPYEVSDGSLGREDVVGVGPLQLGWRGGLDGFCGRRSQ